MSRKLDQTPPDADAMKGVERRLLGAIRRRFGLDAPDPALARLVKRADRIAAHVEAVRLAGFTGDEAARYFGRAEALPEPVLALADPWPTARAQDRYIARFEALAG